MIETKLTENGVKKVVPDDDILAEMFVATKDAEKLRDIVERAKKTWKRERHQLPDDLRSRVEQLLRANPSLRWYDAVAAIASGER